jgi:SAM-dependent methyltransferase
VTVSEELLELVRALAPWHMDIPLAPHVSTRAGNRGSGSGAERMKLVNPSDLRPLLERLYPSGLEGKRFLDCACNAGGYSLLASDLGAYSFGFDVREHWIEQARFLKRHFGKSDEQVRFEVCDLLEAGERLGNERFDICLFKGIFYHLPDPIMALKGVADRTDEVLILDTSCSTGDEDGFLKLFSEGVENPMSGVHHLAWLPTGPGVLARILEWLGFETCLVRWRRPASAPTLGRICIVGARNASLLVGLDAPPRASMVAPVDGDIISGTYALDARISENVVGVGKVEFHVSGADSDEVVIGVATRTWDGWIYNWNTTSVRNGTYRVESLAFDPEGNPGPRDGVTITVEN